MSFFDQVKQSLLDILLVLSSLNPMQREALIRFERCNVDPTNENLSHIINQATDEQMEHLIKGSQYEIEGRNQNDPALQCFSSAQISSFGCIFRLSLLQETLYRYFSHEEIIVLIEICQMPSFPADLQLRSLQQLQQFLSAILPETLKSIHETVKEATDRGKEANKVIFQLLDSCQDQSLLAQPLMQLLTKDLAVMLHIQEYFPKLQSLQLVQLVRLMQMENHWNILEIRQLLSPDKKGWMGLQGLIDEHEVDRKNINSMMDDVELHDLMNDGDDEYDNDHGHGDHQKQNSANYSQENFAMIILEQPPERTVYRRCLKPNPTVVVKSMHQPTLLPGESLCVVPVLYRFDTNQPINHLSGNMPVSSNVGSSSVFKRLKVMKTSHQLDDTLFYLRFELRKTDGQKQSDALAHVHTKPFTVVSHSTLLSQRKFLSSNNSFCHHCNTKFLFSAQSSLPSVNEVVPATGSTQGGTRVVVLGTNFEDTPALLVKFDNIAVIPEYYGAGTLICITPRHIPGQVSVTVSNNAKDYGKSKGTFTFEDHQPPSSLSLSQCIEGSANPLSQSEMDHILQDLMNDAGLGAELLSSGFAPFSVLHYAASFGKKEIVEHLLFTKNMSPNLLDSKGNSALYWALYFGHFDLLLPFVRAGIDINHPNNEGVSLLHLATSISPQLVAKLVYLGSWVNAVDDEGCTPLHMATVYGNAEIVKILLRCGAFLNAQDNEGESPLHYAVRENNLNMVHLLISEGISINCQNEDGETALHMAISSGSSDIIKLLLQTNQCNLNLADCTGSSPLNLALEHAILDQVTSSYNPTVFHNQIFGKNVESMLENTNDFLVKLLLSSGAKFSHTPNFPFSPTTQNVHHFSPLPSAIYH